MFEAKGESRAAVINVQIQIEE